MRTGVLTILGLLCAASVMGQSARVKPTESPTPTPVISRDGKYMPTERKPPVSASATPTPDPDDAEVIRVDSVLVPIPVTVTDAKGREIADLKLSGLELRIDGQLVEISDIARSETPIRLAMLFDNSSSVLVAREFEKNAAIKFFKRVIRPDRDLAALFSLSDYTRLEQPLTREIALLTQAIDLFPPPKGATALLDGIIEVAEYLKPFTGRRVIVIVSDGEDTYSDVRTTLELVIKQLQIDDCQVYIVKTKEFENYKRTGVRGGNANLRALTAERRMIEIASQTGGAVHAPIDEDELNDAFRQISADLAQQYIISYYPEDGSSRRGEFRAITVTVKNRPDLTIRTRKGYYTTRR